MPVAASTNSAICAPPTRADVSKKYSFPSVALNEFGMRYPARQAHACQHPRVLRHQRAALPRIPVQQARRENPALVRNLHGRISILAGNGEHDFAFIHDRIDVAHVARNETLHQIERPLIAQGIVDGSEFFGGMCTFLIPMAPASIRGLSTHGGGTRSVNSLTFSSFSRWTKSGTSKPASIAFIRIASLSRK